MSVAPPAGNAVIVLSYLFVMVFSFR